MLRPEIVESVKNNELDIVVGLLNNEFGKGSSRGLDGCGILSEGGKACSRFVLDSVRFRVEEFKDASDPLGLHGVSRVPFTHGRYSRDDHLRT